MLTKIKVPPLHSDTLGVQQSRDGKGRAMAQWRRKDDEGVPAELLDFEPDDWVLGARSSPERIRMALARWHEARWDWVMVDPWRRTIDGQDVISILFEDAS
jgi:hypothetical protein